MTSRPRETSSFATAKLVPFRIGFVILGLMMVSGCAGSRQSYYANDGYIQHYRDTASNPFQVYRDPEINQQANSNEQQHTESSAERPPPKPPERPVEQPIQRPAEPAENPTRQEKKEDDKK